MDRTRPLQPTNINTDQRFKFIEEQVRSHVTYSTRHNDEDNYKRYKYNASNLVESIITFTSSAKLTKQKEEAITYDASNREARRDCTYFDANGNAWRRTSTTYTYDGVSTRILESETRTLA